MLYSSLKPIMFFDTHCHLDAEAFDADRDAVIARAARAGIVAMVTVGIDVASSRRAIELAHRHPQVYAAVGVHPNECAAAPEDWEETIRVLAADARVVAIGESGLDFYRDRAPAELQREFLHRHLALAHETGKPLILHSRASMDDLLAVLEQHATAPAPASSNVKLKPQNSKLSGILHCFTGTLAQARRGEALGLMISFGGVVTFKKSDDLRQVLAQVDGPHLLFETDAPFLAPQSVRGRRNEPAHVQEVARMAADQRGIGLAEAARLATTNACHLFGIGEPS